MQPPPLSPQTPEECQRFIHELQNRQIELERQNKELLVAQARVEAERARYFDLYDQAPVSYITLSEQGLIQEANLTLATLLGTARDTLVNQSFSRFIHQDDQDIYDLHRKQLLATGTLQKCDLRLVKPNGGYIWAHLKATAAQADDGAPLCRVVLTDISDYKRENEALRESKERFRKLVTSANSVILHMDSEGRITFFNEFAQRLFGYTAEEVLGRSVMETIVPKTDITGVDLHNMILDIVRHPDSYAQNENENMRRDGSRVWISWTNTPIFNDEGDVYEILCIGNDITERKRAEEENKRFRTIADNAVYGKAIANLQGHLLYVVPELKLKNNNKSSCCHHAPDMKKMRA
ncbi:PAS domain-containing protein [Desulfobulbus alkaliphilus]|uniref:PAS domain-containing protein n=1 Tax=Desulfobulbus alkaliphilus TaxID=869814 RepID=UPI00196528A6|nr:PAS domain-containing protein [Desulfobulbus alkaliphilus]MBM9537284.1 PAS domain-containing protein [Desulfobulbus alkaliphilus]